MGNKNKDKKQNKKQKTHKNKKSKSGIVYLTKARHQG